MPDLDERFRSLGRTSAPDLWRDAQTREPRTGPVAPSPSRRVAVAALAFAVAIAGIGVAVWAFRGGTENRRTPLAPAVDNGRITYASDGDLWTIEPDGTDARKLTSGLPGFALQPSWSPDGTQLVLVIESYQDPQPASKGGNFDLYLIEADGSGLTRLTTDGLDFQPSWSPDGTRIAYSLGTPDGTQDIWVVNPDGSDPVALTHERSQALALSPSWSPDGSKILFVSNRTSTPQIYVMNADGTDETQLTHDPAFHENPEYSPDGTRIAFASDLDGPGIYVMNADGTGIEQLTHDAQVGQLNLRWAPDGTKIVYTTSPQANENIVMYVLDPATKALTQIGPKAGQVTSPAWQPVPVPESSPTSTPTETSSPSLTGAHVAATIDVGPNAQTSSILYADGSVWITASGVEGGGGADKAMVFRIDPTTNEIVARIPVDATPTWEIGGGGIASGDGSIWVTGSGRLPGQGSGAVLDRIDPATNEVVAIMFLGGSFGADVVVDDSGVWVLIFDTDGSTEVLRLDQATGEVVATIGLDAEWAHRIFSAAGAIWVNAGLFRHSTFESGALVKIDPVTNSIEATLPNAEFGTFDPGAGVIWTTAATGDRDGLARIDPETVQFVGDPIPIPVARGIPGLGLMAGDPGGIWFEGYDDSVDGDAGSIERYNPATGEIDASVPTPKGGPLQMAVAPGSLWTVNYDGTVTRIDLG